ncbi:neuronal growth regulator 1 isoform X3 [Ictidomys tridecemlineatus]|uniref:neuronal growth regulator 1 isoform X3 n=1 Tax=Ictidomys tridecemlineatus TaxID=43179 RepID=UPI001A9F77FF|nr:neuronal growth regulator 1 isoform X3 [Ictidomys tridecemlineatus]
MDMMLLVQGACCSNQWLAAVLLSLCCLLPSCLPAGQSVDFPWATVDNMMVRKGDTAVLRCYLEDGASKGAWLNRSSIIFAGGDKWSVDPRVSISTLNKRDYSLQIQNVDVTDDGPYTCSVQTQHTPRTMQVHLTVQVPPKIYDISSDMTINEGTNVTLTCLATGKPEPSISWRHISPSAKSFENGQYLDIYGITRDQAGEYECSAENDVSFSDVKKVKVVVNFAPTIQEIKSGTVIPGRSGLIRCEGAGVPPPAFEWYKGEKKLFNGQQGIIIQNFSTRSILTVTNVTQEHFGNYTCVAANKLGTTNASLPLNQIIEPTTSSPVTSPAPSTAQYGITGSADVLFSCWYLVLTLSSFTSIFYLKNAILQ